MSFTSPFTILETRGKRRLGRLRTLHGDIFTPAFGPDATRGVIKNLSPDEYTHLQGASHAHRCPDASCLREHNELQFLLTNTYHMSSYPGDRFIRQMGGLHQCMKWERPILTDSGGFQVFSLIHGAKNLKGKVNDEGAFFNHPYTGEHMALTPETAIDIQFNFGSDIMVVLDDCRHYQDEAELEASVHRTIAWAERCKRRFVDNLQQYHTLSWNDQPRPLLFAVVQGGIDLKLRKFCTERLIDIGFDGYGFGGWAINEKEYFPFDVMSYVADMLPEDKPRYAMGVGTPDNMLRCIEYGYDLFDCTIPTRNARHGLCYTSEGPIRITNSRFKTDQSPLDPNLKSAASDYPKSFLYHLFKIKDASGGKLLTLHNLTFFNSCMTAPFE